MTNRARKTTRKIKNSILAIPAAAAEIPVKPKTPATIETIRKKQRPFQHTTLPGYPALNGACGRWFLPTLPTMTQPAAARPCVDSDRPIH